MTPSSTGGITLHVVAAVLRAPDGSVLLAERPAGKQLAGFWEFPGGKLEPGEALHAALARELHEELGIAIGAGATPFLQVPRDEPGRHLLLDVWLVVRWSGVPRGMEGQGIAWWLPREVRADTLAPADREILRVLCAHAPG